MTLHSGLVAGDLHGAKAFTGSGSPVGVRTPGVVGELYMENATPFTMWEATGLTNTSWTALGPGGAPIEQNYLINSSFQFWNRHAANNVGVTTARTIADNAYGPDRWKLTRENADLQAFRTDVDSAPDGNFQSRSYASFSKITNTGKFLVMQIVGGIESIGLRNRKMVWQCKMNASVAMTVRMAIIQLTSAGSTNVIPNPFVTAWNANTVDPTFGANLSVVGSVESKSVGTGAVETFSVSGTIPNNSRNLIVALWTDSQQAAGSVLRVVDPDFFVGTGTRAWRYPIISKEADDCLRYYEVWGAIFGGPSWPRIQAYGAAGQTFEVPLTFVTSKHGFATVTKRGTWTATNCSQPTFSNVSLSGCTMGVTVTALGSFLSAPDTGDDSVEFDAEL